jgi:dihydroorotase
MLHHASIGDIPLERIAEKMSHAVADCYNIAERGYIREGYFADLVMVDLKKPYTVSNENILYKCGWSPLLNFTFPASIINTMVNGNIVYGNDKIISGELGKRLLFNKN